MNSSRESEDENILTHKKQFCSYNFAHYCILKWFIVYMDEILTLYSFICQCNELVFFWQQKESFIVLTNKFPFLYFESTLKRLLGGFLFITQHRETRVAQKQINIVWRSFYTTHLYQRPSQGTFFCPVPCHGSALPCPDDDS